jgi:hypothetical protein
MCDEEVASSVGAMPGNMDALSILKCASAADFSSCRRGASGATPTFTNDSSLIDSLPIQAWQQHFFLV